LDKIDQLWNTYNSINEWIRFSDAKAGAVVLIQGVIIGAILQNGTQIDAIVTKNAIHSILGLVTIFLFFYSFSLALICLNPSLDPAELARFRRKPLKSDKSSLIFFGDIAARPDFATFQSEINTRFSDEKDFAGQLSNQIWINSKIATRKYQAVEKSIRALATSILIICVIGVLSRIGA
jgi:hypothetical protein